MSNINNMEWQVVVLGESMSGKTFLINNLLGQTDHGEFAKRTASCVRREGEVAGRKLVAIDTPGWWKNYRLIDTAQFIKQELMLSVTKCTPGPHAFILVICTDALFTENIRKSLEEHLGLFGEKIWERTIVVFTRLECLEGKTIEQHIESEGKALKRLVDKCGNRFHASSEGHNNIKQLLELINNVIAGCGNIHFDFSEKTLLDIEEKRGIVREKALLRQQNLTAQRNNLQKYGVITSLQEIRICMLGWLMSGKMAASRTILGQNREVSRARTTRSVRDSGLVSGKQVSVVVTPGWWKYLPARCNPDWVRRELQKGMSLDSRTPHAVLLAVPVDSAFLEEQRKITEDNMKMFGEQVWRHTMVLFTCGDILGNTSIEEHIESEGAPLQWLVEKCGNRYHVQSWYDSEEKVKELLEKIEEMVSENSLYKPEPKTKETVLKETTEDPEAMQNEIACLLDQKWQRMDKAMEEKMTAIWSGTTPNSNRSKDAEWDFSDTSPHSEDASHQIQLKQEDEAQLQEQHADQMERMKEVQHADQMERMKEMLEKELGRWEMAITERFQRMLSEVNQSSDSSSEVDVQQLDRSIRKVLRWVQHGTSGIGSEYEPDTEEHGPFQLPKQAQSSDSAFLQHM